MQTYLSLLKSIMMNGNDKKGRNGMTRSLFALQFRHDMRFGFPLLTTKKMSFRLIVSELLWFISGSSDDNDLKKLCGNERTIWTDNAEAKYWTTSPHRKYPGDLGRIYGVQWREWNGCIDQLANVIHTLRTNPNDRRMVVTAWNPGELDQMALPPCHMIFQFYAFNGLLSLHMVQRSCDMFLGVSFNIASYGLLLEMVAQVTGMKAHELVITFNDAHIYHEHFDAVNQQLGRNCLKLPKLGLSPGIREIDDFTMGDIVLMNYESHPAIKAKMIV